MEMLLDFCFGLGSLLGAGLVLYGAWLCLHELNATKGSRDEPESEAVLRQPRPRVRAGTGPGPAECFDRVAKVGEPALRR